jgi:hypothetical protein
MREMTNFKEANQAVHPVATQWHYNTMTNAGFTAVDTEGVGFVRSYRYTKGNHCITVSTGFSADHWVDDTSGARGYWGTLAAHVAGIE